VGNFIEFLLGIGDNDKLRTGISGIEGYEL
jgi:hypothetical protein